MTTDWQNPCGVAYRSYDDGRFEVQGVGFPSYAPDGAQAKQLATMWDKWGKYAEQGSRQSGVPAAWLMAIMYAESGGKTGSFAPCTEKLCPALFRSGGCASQGGPHAVCAGGLMGFISSTAAMYGKSLEYYTQDDAHEGEMVVDAADLIKKKIAAAGGCVLCGFKGYNGGSPCKDTGLATGPGIVGMYGQGNYVEKIVKLCNTFVAMNLAPSAGASLGDSGGLVVLGALALVGWMLATKTDQGRKLVRRTAQMVG
jgi:hypothetical protein